MNIKNIIKVIYLVSTLINLSPPGKATETLAIGTRKNLYTKNIILYKRFFHENIKVSQEKLFNKNKNNFIRDSKNESIKTARKESPLILANLSNSQKELEIQSEIQSEENNILNAEGNVLVFYKGNILKADSLIYDKNNEIITAKGNVSLNIGEQIFKMLSLKYDFSNKKGYLFDVKGLIKTDNLIDDLFSNFENSDIKKNEILKEIKKDKVRYTSSNVENWVFFTDKIQIDGNKWISDKVILTNDLLELKQVKIEVNSLEAVARKKELRFKSALNFLILDEKINIPFWFGNRTFTKEIKYENSWNVEFDNLDKDGLYIGRKLNSINIFDGFTLDLEPQFLIQRSLKGYTKSFVNKGDSITGDKVKSNATLKDYFALNSQIKGQINKWNLEIDQQNNSLDPAKFSDAIRLKTNLSKDIIFLNSKWNKSFYGIYRDRVWNGSLGENEIYAGYGSKLQKQNSWVFNGISNTEVLSLGFANLKGEALNRKNLVKTTKGNFFYSLDQKIPITIDEPSNLYVDSSYNYIPEPINKGLSLNTKLELLYSFYASGNNQQYLGIGAGPELVFGDFKKKSFDYTRISLLPFYKFKSGDSLFKFDQISDKLTVGIDFDQQLIGPLILKNSATLKVSREKDYTEFINSKISLNWKKRSYEFGIFYQPHNEAGGISFSLFGFK